MREPHPLHEPLALVDDIEIRHGMGTLLDVIEDAEGLQYPQPVLPDVEPGPHLAQVGRRLMHPDGPASIGERDCSGQPGQAGTGNLRVRCLALVFVHRLTLLSALTLAIYHIDSLGHELGRDLPSWSSCLTMKGSAMADIEYLISADSHLVEPYDLWEKALASKWGDAVPRKVDDNGNPLLFTGIEYIPIGKGIIDQTAEDPDVRALVLRAGADPDARVKCLDIDGVDFEVLNSTWMLYAMRIEDGDLRRDCARVYNDWAAEFAASHPDRFLATAMVPVDDIGWACQEIERTTAMGLKGAIVFCANLPGLPPYRDKAYDPLWETAVATDNPILLHIITGNERDPFTMGGDELGGAAGATVAILQEVQPTLANEFIFGRVLDRFPELNVLLGEYEVAWLPNLMWRLDQLANEYPAVWGLRDLKQPVRDLALKRVHHGFISDPYVVQVVDTLGHDMNLTWGSDFPHVRCTFPNSKPIVQERLEGLPQDVVDRITYKTAAELFKINLPANV